MIINNYIKELYINKPEIQKIINEKDSLNERLDIFLINEARISYQDVYAKLAKLLGMDISNPETIRYESDIVKKVSSEFITKNKCLPLFEEQETIICGIADPLNNESIRLLNCLLNKEIKLILIPNEKIQRINSIIYSKVDNLESVASITNNTDDIDSTLIAKDADIINAPIVKLVDSILKEAIARNTSDIHIEPFEDSIRIRYRIDGVLYNTQVLQKNIYHPLIARLKIISGLNISERRKSQDGRIKKEINGIEYDFRISTLPLLHGEKVVIRILESERNSIKQTELGFSEYDKIQIKDLLRKPYGIILVTGPTGCGKSTTLYSFIQELNQESRNIVTVEDPIEYTIKGVNQVQVNTKIDYTFASILRSILRQDPNIIMIGEIRDEETAIIAMRLAITGHLVLSTLHTNDAVSAIMRLSDLGIGSYFISTALKGVIAQRLVRKLCSECKKEHLTTKEENEILGLNESIKIYEPVGCEICHKTGYKGRTGIHEIFIVKEEIKDLIMKNTPINKIRLKALKDGMNELSLVCIKLVKDGITSMDELYKLIYAHD